MIHGEKNKAQVDKFVREAGSKTIKEAVEAVK